MAGMHDRAGYAAAHVLRDVPMLDADGLAEPAGAVVGVCCYVADGEDAGKVWDGEVDVCFEGAVLSEGDGGVFFEEVGCGADADT